eukprot:6399208-Prymnesium_polylepis.2
MSKSADEASACHIRDGWWCRRAPARRPPKGRACQSLGKLTLETKRPPCASECSQPKRGGAYRDGRVAILGRGGAYRDGRVGDSGEVLGHLRETVTWGSHAGQMGVRWGSDGGQMG